MEKRIEQYLEHLSETLPSAPGIVFGDKNFTYFEFNVLCNQLSHILIENLNPNKASYIGIYMDRSPEMLIAIFAILKAGAAYVPIDPKFPEARVSLMIENADIDILITQNKYSNNKTLNSSGCKLITADIENWQYTAQPVSNPEKPGFINEVAYILYTSGSTGVPKGAMLGHHSVINLLIYMQKQYPLEQPDVILFKSPFTFDGSVWEIFGWLLPQCKLCIALPGVEKDPALLFDTFVKYRINFAFFVSSMLSVFIDYLDVIKPTYSDFAFKWMSVGGEVVTPLLVRRFYKYFDPAECGLINVYGPTETCVYATIHYCRQDVEYHKVPVGKTVNNDFIYILDENLNPVENGKSGEIFIGGAGVAYGYLKQEVLTSQKFLPDPFRPGSKIYRTGDIGLILPDGELDFIGRTDNQVKLRGQRIELGEIEHAILKIGGIKEAVAEVRKAGNLQEQLIGFFVKINSGLVADNSTQLITGDEKARLTAKLSNLLPAFMIPDEFVEYKHFPLSFNGKTDRKLLQLPEIQNIGEESVAPLFEGVKGKLQSIWKQLLKQNDIKDDDHFFKLGGHSLIAASMSTQVLKETGVQLSLDEVFRYPVFGELADCLLSKKSLIQKLNGINKVTRNRDAYPVLPSQQELWVLHKMDITGTHHNIVFELDITGYADYERFNAALNFTIRDYEIFRTTFEIQENELMQIVSDELQYQVFFHDFSRFSISLATEKLKKLILETGQTHINLDRLPLFAFHWIKLADSKFKIIFLIHHLIFDGGSMFPLFSNIKSHYLDLKNSDEYHPLAPEIQNIDHAVWFTSKYTRQPDTDLLQYWVQQFKTIPNDLKLKFRKSAEFENIAKFGERYWWTIEKQLLDQLKSLASLKNCSLFSLLLTCYKINLFKHSGNPDIVVGTPFANRSLPEEEWLIGYFTNMLALRDTIKASQGFATLLDHVQQTNLNGFSHSGLSFGQLVNHLELYTTPGHYPLFQVIFVLQNWAFPDMEFDGLLLKQKELGSNAVKAELYLNAEETDHGMEFWIEFDTALYDQKDIIAFADDFNKILRNVILNPDGLIFEIAEIEEHNDIRSIHKPACVVIGETNLLVRCCEMLFQAGILVEAIISPDNQCISWAVGNNIPFYNSYQGIEALMSEQKSYDYIFSIVNSVVLREGIINKARIAVINYHDSLLPENAGLFASNWAILKGSSQHGITWHKVLPKLDAGDILVQKSFEINKEETASVVNLRSYESAIQAFGELILGLKSGGLTVKSQNLTQRSYNNRFKRPNGICWVDFNHTAEDIYKLCKACDMGSYVYNEFGLPRLVINNQLYILKNINTVKTQNDAKPGSVISLESNTIIIATAKDAVTISEFYSAEGDLISVGQFAERHNLKSGSIIPLSSEYGSTDFPVYRYKQYIQNESFWVEKLLNYEPLTIPVLSVTENLKKGSSYSNRRFLVSAEAINALKNNESAENAGLKLASAVALFIAKMNDSNSVILPVIIDNETIPLINKSVPVEFNFDKQKSFSDQIEDLIHSVQTQILKGSFFRDIFIRHPQLALIHPDFRFYNSLITFIIGGKHQRLSDNIQTDCIYFMIEENSIEVVFQNVFINLQHKEYEYFIFHLEQFLIKLAFAENNIKSLSLLTDAELTSLTHPATKNENSSINRGTVLQMFTTLVKAIPDSIAIIQGNIKVTYSQLDNMADNICRILLSKGLTAGEPVGIISHRSPAVVSGILGILKAGGAYLPLDLNYPDSRLKVIIELSALKFALVSEEAASIFYDKIPYLINLDNYKIESQVIPVPNINVQSPAYIIFTSGSTGKPKGVEISHLALNSFVCNALKRYEFSKTDRVLQFATLTFDTAVEEIFVTLCSGATLVLRNNEPVISAGELLNLAIEQQITVLDLPTAYWQQLILTMENEEKEFPDSVRMVIIGGEAAQEQGIRVWKKIARDKIRLLNTYGPTETTVVASCCYLDESDADGSFPIGIPMGETQFYIVDQDLNPVLNGMPGQLLISGPQLATRYVGEEEQTRLKFLGNHLSKDPDSRLYLSGDLVKQNKSGFFIYLGRVDSQVKIRGFRVEPQEIDHILSSSELINSSFTKVDVKGDLKRLVSYVVPKQTNQGIEKTLTEFLKDKLPGYMIPSAIVVLEAFPLNRNLKIDTSALPTPVFSEFAEADEILSETEIRLKALFLETLKIDNCGASLSFFVLGGNSLLSLTLVSKMHETFGLDLPIARVYENPSIRQLAAVIDSVAKIPEISKPIKFSNKYISQLQAGDTNPPVFSVYLDAANGWLPALLGDKQTFFAFLPEGSDGERVKHNKVETIAKNFIETMLQLYPDGKIHLIGFSFGGLVALEIAVQLKKIGINLQSLTLIDTVAPEVWREMIKSADLKAVYKWTVQRLKTFRYFIVFKKLPSSLRSSYILSKWRRAAFRYQPLADDLSIKFYLLRSSQSLSDLPLLGWENWPVFNIDVTVFEGDHHSIIRKRENVDRIAQWLKAHILRNGNA